MIFFFQLCDALPMGTKIWYFYFRTKETKSCLQKSIITNSIVVRIRINFSSIHQHLKIFLFWYNLMRKFTLVSRYRFTFPLSYLFFFFFFTLFNFLWRSLHYNRAHEMKVNELCDWKGHTARSLHRLDGSHSSFLLNTLARGYHNFASTLRIILPLERIADDYALSSPSHFDFLYERMNLCVYLHNIKSVRAKGKKWMYG